MMLFQSRTTHDRRTKLLSEHSGGLDRLPLIAGDNAAKAGAPHRTRQWSNRLQGFRRKFPLRRWPSKVNDHGAMPYEVQDSHSHTPIRRTAPALFVSFCFWHELTVPCTAASSSTMRGPSAVA